MIKFDDVKKSNKEIGKFEDSACDDFILKKEEIKNLKKIIEVSESVVMACSEILKILDKIKNRLDQD